MPTYALPRKSWRQPTSEPAGFTLAAVSDDETLARRAATTLEREGMIVNVSAAGPEVSVLEHADALPDLVLLRRAPNRPGLEHILLWTRHRFPTAARIVVLPSPDSIALGTLLAAGAQGILEERRFEAALGPVVRAVTTGHICVPAERRLVIEPPALSYRERQILALAVAGLSNGEIAERLYLSQSTVKTHLSAVFRQLGVHSRREAAALVLASDGALRRTVLGTLGMADTPMPREGT